MQSTIFKSPFKKQIVINYIKILLDAIGQQDEKSFMPNTSVLTYTLYVLPCRSVWVWKTGRANIFLFILCYATMYVEYLDDFMNPFKV